MDSINFDKLYRLLATSIAVAIVLALVAHYHALQREIGHQILQQTSQSLTASIAERGRMLEAGLEEARSRARFYAGLPLIAAIGRQLEVESAGPATHEDRSDGRPVRSPVPGAGMSLHDWLARLQEVFYSAVSSWPETTMVRLIGLADGGRELVRVERSPDTGLSFVVPESGLQRKGHRYYLREAAALAPGEVYLSAIDLNREHGKIKQPEVPTLRAVMPVRQSDDSVFGVLVVNLDMQPLLVQLAHGLPPGALLYLVDSEGRYLLHAEPGRAFRHEHDTSAPGWRDEFTPFVQVSNALGVKLPKGMQALNGPQGVIVFVPPREVVLGAAETPNQVRLQLGMPLAALQKNIRDQIIRQMYPAVLLAVLSLALIAGILILLDRKRAVRQLSERLTRATKAGKLGVWEYLPNTDCFTCNDELLRIRGLSGNQLSGHFDAFQATCHPDDREKLRNAFVSGASNGEFILSFRVLLPDGSVRHAESRGMVSVDSTGKPIRLTGTELDVTERRQAEESLQNSESRFRALTEAAPYGILAVNARGVIVLVNAQLERDVGYSRDELIGKQLEMLVPRRFSQEHAGIRQQYLQAPVARAMGSGRDLTVLRKDGSEYPAEIALSPFQASGESMILAAIVNTTERRNSEDRLREMQKMEAIGQLTGGLAHDFNNLLGVVVGNLDLLGEELPPDEHLQRRHRMALEAALRGAGVTRSLLAVARRQQLTVEVHDLNKLVEEVLPLLKTTVGSGITVHTVLWDEPLLVKVDASAFANALLNLAINARDAMKGQSGDQQLVLSSRQHFAVPTYGAQLAPGAYALIKVRDTGPGMSKEVQERAFTPFFTTKETGHGTGLGLAMVRGFVEQLGGGAVIESAPLQGTTVKLYLPLMV